MSEQPEPSPRLGITCWVVDKISVLTVSGEIDHTTGEQFHQALSTVHTEPPVRTVVDLSGVTFMDSSGLRAIIMAYRATQNTQGWIRLAAPTPAVRRVVEIIGLDTVIDSYPSVDQALTDTRQ